MNHLDFLKIWDDAYNAFCDGGEESLDDFLNNQVTLGNIDKANADCIKDDVIETYKL